MNIPKYHQLVDGSDNEVYMMVVPYSLLPLEIQVLVRKVTKEEKFMRSKEKTWVILAFAICWPNQLYSVTLCDIKISSITKYDLDLWEICKLKNCN